MNDGIVELYSKCGQTLAIGKLNKGEVVTIGKLRMLFAEWKERTETKRDGSNHGRLYWPATAYCEAKLPCT